MKKILKFLAIFIFVLGIILWMFNVNHVGNETNREKLGANNAIEISINDYYNVKNNMLQKYFDFITSKQYEKAYYNLVKEYRDYKTLEEYIGEVEQIDFQNIEIKEIKLKNDNMYVSKIDIDGIEHIYHVYVNTISNIYNIFPDSFLDYYSEETNLNKWGFKCKINNCLIEKNKVTINMDINNDSAKDIEINNIYMISEDDYKYSMTNPKITLKSKESINVDITYDTDYTFPKSIKIEKKDVGSTDYKYYTTEIKH